MAVQDKNHLQIGQQNKREGGEGKEEGRGEERGNERERVDKNAIVEKERKKGKEDKVEKRGGGAYIVAARFKLELLESSAAPLETNALFLFLPFALASFPTFRGFRGSRGERGFG